MVYIREFSMPSERAQTSVIAEEGRTFFNSFYPFGLFPDKGLFDMQLEPITVFYGTNGSGKSTLINIMAEKVGAVRYSEYNNSPFLSKFANMCSVKYNTTPRKSFVLTSDDVFDYSLKARSVNDKNGDKRGELVEEYIRIHAEAEQNPEIMHLSSLDDYERWSTTMEILSPRRTQSSYVKRRVGRDVDLYSNGETAMRYFLDRIDADALYFLDEPENSLSIERQIELAEYIAATARATKSQFVIATHSPIILSMRGAKIYNLDARPVTTAEWTELPNVRRYFDFFMEHKNEFPK